MNSQNNINAFTDLSRFGELRSEAGKNPSNAVGQVAKEFEALFIEMMLSSARKAAIKGGMFESHALELYREMFDSQTARVLAEKGTLGFEQAISRFVGIDAEDAAANDQNPSSEWHKTTDRADTVIALQNDLSLPVRRADLPIPSYQTSSSELENRNFSQRNPENGIAKSVIEERKQAAPITNAAGASGQYSFSQNVAPYASEAAKKLGTEPSILIAQAALETGWGMHIIPAQEGGSSNNLFGIKANSDWQGVSSEVNTLEFLGGRPINTRASFRSYPDLKSAFDDYVKFVTENPRYRSALDNAKDGESYIRELARAGYATDPNYADKIISIKNRIEKMDMLANKQLEAPQSEPSNLPN